MKWSQKTPHLQLAPMEGVGDRAFRKAMASVGGFDEAVRDFLRVPCNAHVQSLAKVYHPQELRSIPLAAQIMGADPFLMGAMAYELMLKGAPRIDINCGCPSNTVTGKGAGSSLLKDPNLLNAIAKAVVKAVSIPVTLKMRSGYEDTSLFQENLFAAQESGITYLTVHPRTKVDGYGPPAKWELIAQAKSLLRIPVIGNGDITSVLHAQNCLKETRCDGLMIGRGSLINPFIFHEIKAFFNQEPYAPSFQDLKLFLTTYLQEIALDCSLKTQVNKLKQLFGFLFKKTDALLEKRQWILSSLCKQPEELLNLALPLLQGSFSIS